jgi:hypothetical protein
VYALIVLVLKVYGYNEPGYTSMMVAILFLGGVQLITIGIAGRIPRTRSTIRSKRGRST